MFHWTEIRRSELGGSDSKSAQPLPKGHLFRGFNVHAPIKCNGKRYTTLTIGFDTGAHGLTKLEISHAHGMHVSVVHRSPSHFIGACTLTCMDEAAPVPLVMADMPSSPLLEHRTEQNP